VTLADIVDAMEEIALEHRLVGYQKFEDSTVSMWTECSACDWVSATAVVEPGCGVPTYPHRRHVLLLQAKAVSEWAEDAQNYPPVMRPTTREEKIARPGVYVTEMDAVLCPGATYANGVMYPCLLAEGHKGYHEFADPRGDEVQAQVVRAQQRLSEARERTLADAKAQVVAQQQHLIDALREAATARLS
jgi:hypothetical protein